MLPVLMSKESVDRLAVLVSGEGLMRLLGGPKLTSGTRKEVLNRGYALF